MQVNKQSPNGRRSVQKAQAPFRILVIDDDPETAALLKIILEPNDFNVVIAGSGREGVEMARTINPDVIIVDLVMPEMDGMSVCREVRRFSRTPILVLSAVNKPGIAAEALDQGADDFLVKPMSNTVLIASVNKLARRARSEQISAQTPYG